MIVYGMSYLSSHRFRKILKIFISAVFILIFSYFLIIFFITYLFLGYTSKKAMNKKQHQQEQVITAPDPTPVKSYDKLESNKTNVNQDFLIQQNFHRYNKLKQDLFFIKEVVALRNDERLKSAPNICDILCSQSNWVHHEKNVDLREQFNLFLQKEGTLAFGDPKFRLVLAKLDSNADILLVLGNSLENIEPLVNKKSELSESEKIYWSLKAPLLIASVATKIKELYPKIQKKNKIINKLIELNKKCAKYSITEIEDFCWTINQSNGLTSFDD